jgi:hypothetical protein
MRFEGEIQSRDSDILGLQGKFGIEIPKFRVNRKFAIELSKRV